MDPFRAKTAMPTVDAGTLALKAVAFVAADEGLLPRFVALTGCGSEDLKARLIDPAFLGGVLDFVLGDEPTAAAFAEAEGLPPEALMQARARLP